MGGYGIQTRGTSPILKKAGTPGPVQDINPSDLKGPELTDNTKKILDEKPRYKLKKGGQAKVSKVMKEFRKGKLHSGSKKGPVVKSRKQAIAIALSEAGMSKKKK